MLDSELKKKNVLVLGTGKTGFASANFLIGKANKVFISDSQDPPVELKNKIEGLRKLGAEVEFKKNSDDFINKADLVIISPGISPNTEVAKKLFTRKIPVISDIELAKNYIKKPIIAVTGTNGKTTTTSLITHIINSSGKKAVSCGNIGKPVLEVINDKNEYDFYVAEISSFQIFYSPTLLCKVAICLNITPDHLDWHGSLEHYTETKKKLFQQQDSNSWAILNYCDEITKNITTKGKKFYFSSKSLSKKEFDSLDFIAFVEDDFLKFKYEDKITQILNKNKLNIVGDHNIENSLASIAASKVISIPDTEVSKALSSFEGVEHRLEFVRKLDNKEFYNDSKATNPEATIKAIEAFKGKKITLILGGRDKNTALSEMIDIIKKNVSEVILFGEAKERFQKELTNNRYNDLRIVSNLNDAIQSSLISKTEVVLFSPACSSFDMFKNYEERGKIFKELVSKY